MARAGGGGRSGGKLRVFQFQTKSERPAVFRTDPEDVTANDERHKCSGQSRDPAGFLLGDQPNRCRRQCAACKHLIAPGEIVPELIETRRTLV